jgi:hypothetical protein
MANTIRRVDVPFANYGKLGTFPIACTGPAALGASMMRNEAVATTAIQPHLTSHLEKHGPPSDADGAVSFDYTIDDQADVAEGKAVVTMSVWYRRNDGAIKRFRALLCDACRTRFDAGPGFALCSKCSTATHDAGF